MENRDQIPPQRILLVDDEEQMREILQEALTHMGHRVVTARDGEKAVEETRVQGFDIVVTDIHMPRMDGIQLIKYLNENHPSMDIVAITGHSMDYTYTDVVRSGASDFIIKPFTLNELEAKVRRIVRERVLRQELEHLAVHDPLTGLYNRRYFEDAVRREAVRATRYHHALLLFFIDIDRFKSFNDEKGHQAGDLLLKRFAAILQQCIRRDVDIACRYGGDEFVILTPHLLSDQAMIVVDRIRERYNELEFAPTNLSIGIAQLKPSGGGVERDVEDMIRRADKALYYAKHSLGGDCGFIYEVQVKQASV